MADFGGFGLPEALALCLYRQRLDLAGYYSIVEFPRPAGVDSKIACAL